jgi:cadmium resistance protein CadD (predicted permease)
MIEVLTVIAVTAGAYIGTNLDNLILLVALYARFPRRTRTVAMGYIVGMLVIGAISIAIGEGGGLIPIDSLGILGMVPIALGIMALFQLFQNRQSGEAARPASEVSTKAVFLSVLTTQLSNGADSIITFSVFLAESTDATDYLIALTFLCMIGVFAWLAYYLLRHRRLSDAVDRYGHYVTPFILILVGVYILANTSSDLIPG